MTASELPSQLAHVPSLPLLSMASSTGQPLKACRQGADRAHLTGVRWCSPPRQGDGFDRRGPPPFRESFEDPRFMGRGPGGYDRPPSPQGPP